MDRVQVTLEVHSQRRGRCDRNSLGHFGDHAGTPIDLMIRIEQRPGLQEIIAASVPPDYTYWQKYGIPRSERWRARVGRETTMRVPRCHAKNGGGTRRIRVRAIWPGGCLLRGFRLEGG